MALSLFLDHPQPSDQSLLSTGHGSNSNWPTRRRKDQNGPQSGTANDETRLFIGGFFASPTRFEDGPTGLLDEGSREFEGGSAKAPPSEVTSSFGIFQARSFQLIDSPELAMAALAETNRLRTDDLKSHLGRVNRQLRSALKS